MTPEILTNDAPVRLPAPPLTEPVPSEATPAPDRADAPDIADAVRPSFVATLLANWPFLLLIVPYLLAWAVPFTWCWQEWGNPNHSEFIQPWIPLLAFALIWSRRDHLKALLRAIEKNPPKTWLERGNGAILIFGCLLYLFAHLVQIKGVAVGALLLIAIGAVFALYGGRMVKSLRVPILFSLLMIPPPDSPLDWAAMQFRFKTVKAAGLLLNALHFPNGVNGWIMRFERTGEVVEFPDRCGGAAIIVPVAVLLLWWAIFRRRKPVVWVFLPLLGAVIAFGVNLLRVIAAGALAARSPDASNLLLELNSWWLVALSLPIALGLEWLFGMFRSRESQKAGAKALKTSGAVLSRTGRAMNVITVPFDFLFKGISYFATLWRRSEKRVEAGLKRLFPKRRNKRRY